MPAIVVVLLPGRIRTAFAPTPIAVVQLWAQDGGAHIEVSMLLDSGSDVTIVPASAALAAGADVQPYDVPLLTYDGERVFRDRARLSMKLLRYTFRGEYLVDDLETGILGRNVLNSLVVTLDGPRLTWTATTG